MSDFILDTTHSDWWCLKRADHDPSDPKRIHVPPVGTRAEWESLLADLVAADAWYRVPVPISTEKRLAAAAIGDVVVIWNPKCAGQMDWPSERDYLVVPAVWLLAELRRALA